MTIQQYHVRILSAAFVIFRLFTVNSTPYLIAIGGGPAPDSVFMYDLSSNDVFRGTSSPNVLALYGSVMINDTIFTAGGDPRTWDPEKNKFMQYSLLRDSWTYLSHLPSDGYYKAALLIYENEFVLFGGSAPTSIYKYNSTQSKWNYYSTLRPNLVAQSTVLVKDNGSSAIIVSGGGKREGGVRNASNEVYQSDDGAISWRQIPSMSESRMDHQSVTLGSLVYVMGGTTQFTRDALTLSSLEIYDSVSGEWHTGPPMKTGRQSFGSVMDADLRRLFVCGGFNHILVALDSCEIFMIDENTWIAGPTLSLRQVAFSLFITNTIPAAVTSWKKNNQALCAYPDSVFTNPNTSEKICYRAFAIQLDWPHAVVACQTWGGNLVAINNADENSFVVSLLKKSNITDKAWIGLNSHETFTWDEDDSDVKTTIPSQNASYPLHCVYMAMQAAVQGNWYSQECWSSYSFVCEKPHHHYQEQDAITTTTEISPTTTCSPFGATAQCPDSLSQYGMVMFDRGMCIILGGLGNAAAQKSWSSAGMECNALAGDLVEVNDGVRLKIVNNFAAIAKAQSKANAVWIGLQNSYRWTDGNKLSYIPSGSNLNSSVNLCYSYMNTTEDFSSSSCSDSKVLLPYVCQVVGCPTGMTSVPDCNGVNYICVEENECANGKANCGVSSFAGMCTDLSHDEGRFRCDCQAGFKQAIAGDWHSACIDVRECDNPVTCSQQVQGGVCIEQLGGYLCACKNGFRLTNNSDNASAVLSMQTCVEVDECMENPDVCQNGNCTNIAGGYTCACNPGYQQTNGRCVDTNECALSLYPCGIPTAQAFCYNKPGFSSDYPNGYTCDCPPGFNFQVDNKTCVETNNCQPGGQASCGGDPDARCVNFQNQYYCACSGGRYFDGATQMCMAIDIASLTYSNGTLALSPTFTNS